MAAAPRSPEEIDRILMELILNGGNCAGASKRLAARGIKITDKTLANWRDELHAERYQELQTEYAHKVAEKIASEAEGLAVEYADAERESLLLARQKLGQLRPGELAASAKNFAIAKSIQIEKVSSPLRGRPTQITEHRDPEQILESLARKLGVIDSTAEDMELPAITSDSSEAG